MEDMSLEGSILFKGMTEEERRLCLEGLEAGERQFTKGNLVFHAGDRTDRMGLVLSGAVTIETNDIWGGCSLLGHVGEGEFFAETYALLGEVMPVDVKAAKDSRILLLKVGGFLSRDPDCAWEQKLTGNLLTVSARKNLALSGRNFHISQKSARGRLLSYLSAMALQKNSCEFDIPFDRQELADYLNLERTGMSKELGRMKREGLVEFRKNHFRLQGEKRS